MSKIGLTASIILAVIAIGIAPILLLMQEYQIFGHLGFASTLWLILVGIPIAGTLAGILSLLFAIIVRSNYKYGWLLILLSCVAIIFPWAFLFVVFNFGTRA